MKTGLAGLEVTSLQSYMADIAQYPLVTPKEEVELAGLIAQGSEEAIEKLTLANLRLVVKIAHDYRHTGLSLSDLIAEGNIGLMRAVIKFQPEKGAKFSSYAAWWIKQAMRRAIANQMRVVRVPIQAAAKIRHIKKAEDEMTEELGRAPSDRELADQLDMKEKVLRRNRSLGRVSIVSLDKKVNDEDETTIGDFMADISALLPGSTMNKNDLHTLIVEVITEKLTERERMIIVMRYGIGQPAKTLEEVSALIGRTRERVRQIQHQALRKLKFALMAHDVKSFGAVSLGK